MGKFSRTKGAAAEREVAALIREHGFDAERNKIGVAKDDLIHTIPGASIEIKRSEKLMLPAWIRQTEEQAGDDREPVLFFRQSRQPWRVVVRADYYLDLISEGE